MAGTCVVVANSCITTRYAFAADAPENGIGIALTEGSEAVPSFLNHSLLR